MDGSWIQDGKLRLRILPGLQFSVPGVADLVVGPVPSGHALDIVKSYV